jgi:IMP dehydrogenase
MGYQYIIAGNVATYEGAKFLADCGAAYVKVGVGPGSVCVTRDMTGHGVPQMTAIMEAARGIRTSGNTQAGLIADGGMSTPGDVAKALAAGADLVMSGFIFAGCNETPNPGTYRGMASRQTQVENRGAVSNGTPEGVSVAVEGKGSVLDVFDLFKGGLRSALAYSGCRTLKEFKEGAILAPVSSHTHVENGVRK